MLVIAGRIEIDPAHRSEAMAAAREMMADTRKEPGCISYTFSADLDEEGVFHVFEEWESQEALDAHFQTAHMARFRGLIPGFGLKDMSLQRYEVSSAGPLG